MDKNFIVRLIIPTALLVAAVLSLLMVIPATAATFAWFSWAWAATIVAGAFALRYLLVGIFAKTDVVTKKVSILFSALFMVVTLFCLVFAITLPENWIIPLIAVIITGALFISTFFTGGRKWDSGDNQKVGYKNYYQRKAEEKQEEK